MQRYAKNILSTLDGVYDEIIFPHCGTLIAIGDFSRRIETRYVKTYKPVFKVFDK